MESKIVLNVLEIFDNGFIEIKQAINQFIFLFFIYIPVVQIDIAFFYLLILFYNSIHKLKRKQDITSCLVQ